MNVWRVPYPKFGAGPGLERVAALAQHLGIDLPALGESAVVIVGSNGKGSTAAMTAALLAQRHPDVGLFTSPHLLDLNERFRIGDTDITDADLGYHWDRVARAIDARGLADTIGGFEFLFLIAADWFRARGCSRTVWEAGLGGRLDPVRLLEARTTALTSLDLEHTALLGSTLKEIALEKIAAVKPGHRLIVDADLSRHTEAAAAISSWAAENTVEYVVAPPLDAAPLAGDHQRSNAALALQLAQSLATLSEEQVRAGFAATRWPGRLEALSDDPLVVIDVGHTPDGVTESLGGFQAMRGAREGVLVCGVSNDKDAREIITRIAPAFSVIICAAAHHKGTPAALIAAHAQDANPGAEISLAESVSDARRLAFAKARGAAIYVAGGLFLAAEFKAVHLGRDPASLAFF